MDELAMFNEHQAGTKRAAEFFAKSIFLLSGGALTLSVTLFLGKDAPTVPPELVINLKLAWWTLFASVVSYVCMLGVMLIRDYCFGEIWRKRLNGHNVDATGQPGFADKLMWLLGAIGTSAFLFGLCSLAYVSTSLIK